jgi:hypothetical protein
MTTPSSDRRGVDRVSTAERGPGAQAYTLIGPDGQP